jgi:superfamily II DNA or RNA helicase
MPDISLFDGADVALEARQSHLRILRKRPFPTNRDSVEISVAVDGGMLLEQDLATLDGENVLVAWRDWPAAVAAGAESLTAFSSPSHHLLQIDRLGQLGRPDFRFVVRWLEGSREVTVARTGAYLMHSASGKYYHLDPRALELLEAIDAFNSLRPEERQRTDAVWPALKTVLERGNAVGAELDRHLEDHVVLVPATFGLIINEGADGTVAFTPTLPGSPDSARFEASFEKSLKVGPVMTFERPDRKRVRVLLTPDQEEALSRMQQVRTLRGAEAKTAIENPAAIFDGIADVIDLANITRKYGPRVIGIGPLREASDSTAQRKGSILDGMGDGESDPTPQEGLGADVITPPLPERSSVTVEVVDHQSGEAVPLPLTPDEVQQLRDAVAAAVEAGEPSVTFGGVTIAAEEALVSVLDRHITGEDEPTELGGSGHLYLLINDHESSLTAGLAAPLAAAPPAEEPPLRRPKSMLPEIELQPHQQDGLRWLDGCRGVTNRNGAVLADDMGLGKTLQLLAHIANEIESGAMVEPGGTPGNGPWRPVLIVAPLILVETGVWTDEMAKRFAVNGQIFQPWVVLRDEGLRKVRLTGGGRDGLGKPLLDPARLMAHKVVITTYETMVSYQHSLAQHVDGKSMWSMVIFDEAQEVKSPKTKSSYAAKALDAKFRVAATGTPVETRLRDLWNLLDTVEPTRLGTQRDFVARYERPAMNGSTDDREAALSALRSALGYTQPAALLLRRDKTVLHNLPPRHDHAIECELTAIERTTMQRILSGMRGTSGQGRVLSALQQLHLASQHPMLVGGRRVQAPVEELLEASGRLNALVDTLREIEAKSEKVLVFARSTEAQRLLASVLGRVFGRPVEVVNGQTGVGASGGRAGAGAMRREILQRFRASLGFDVIILSPFVAGVGLTLTEANHVIHYGRWWNPAVENQATDRAYRIGQTRPVHVYSLIGVDSTGAIPKTLDQAVDELLRERRELARDFLMPPSEEQEARRVMDQLDPGRSTVQADSLVPGSIETVGQLGALLTAIAKAKGHQSVWLGEEGLFGIHLLRRTPTGIEAVRIVREESEGDDEHLKSGAGRWQELLGGGPVSGGLLVAAGAYSGKGRSWSDIENDAANTRVTWEAAWIPASVCRDVREVCDLFR